MGTRIESIGLFQHNGGSKRGTIELVRRAAERCISQSGYDKEDIGVLVNVSVYQDEIVAEPAYATFIQNDLKINHGNESCQGAKTLSFDLLNGAMGFLNGCQVASAMIAAGKARAGLVVSGDMVGCAINESGSPPGLCVSGSAMLLGEAPDTGTGFDSFYFKEFVDNHGAYESYIFFENKRLSMVFQKDPAIEKIYLDTISRGVSEFLAREGIGLDAFDLILPSQVSPEFVSAMADLLGVERERIIDVTREDGDLFNASLPTAMEYVLKNDLASPGQRALIINVGSGVQVGCAIYNF